MGPSWPFKTHVLKGHVVCMFAVRTTKDPLGLEGWAAVFDLNTYFRILVTGEGAAVKHGKGYFLLGWGK